MDRRFNVYTRDNFTCQDCWIKGVRLECHHKIPFAKIVRDEKIQTLQQARDSKLLFDIKNWLTLCILCHKKTDNYGKNYRGENKTSVGEFLSTG